MAQFGVIRRNESQRRERQVSAMRPASITTWSTPAFARCQLVARPAWPAPTIATSTLRSMREAVLLDQVALCRFNLDPAGLQVSDATIQLIRLTCNLEEEPTLVARHVGASDVRDDLELLAQLVDDRLLDHGRSEDQLASPPTHRRESILPASAGRRALNQDASLKRGWGPRGWH